MQSEFIAAMVFADGGQLMWCWGACAVVPPSARQLNHHKELITVVPGVYVGPATAEAFAVLAGLRLLRRSETDARYFGILIVDRAACFANLCDLLKGSR